MMFNLENLTMLIRTATGELNADNETRQIYGKIFILFISVLSGALVSSAIAEMRDNKFDK